MYNLRLLKDFSISMFSIQTYFNWKIFMDQNNQEKKWIKKEIENKILLD